MGTFTAKRCWLAVACALAPSLACAAGLGKITVHSALGQPLRAEVEVVSLQPGEAESLNAKLAPIAAFRQADIEYNVALQSVRFSIERRPGGNYVVLMTSVTPINEPYVDMLVEVNWASGKLVREYTFLLDPPEYRPPTLAAARTPPPAAQAAPAPAPAAAAPNEPAQPMQAPAAAPAEPAEAAPKTGEAEPAGGEPASEATAQPAADAVKPPEARELPAKSAVTYEVKRGDTLAKIALRNKVEGVTLQQMLVALFRANQDAFMGDNMNRLRAGKIITIPDKEQMAAVGATDARRFVGAQMADFADYRRSLGLAVAEAPARGDAGRQASGKIAAAAEQQPTPPKEPAKDQLRLSTADDAKGGGKAAATAARDDAAAKDKALKEANERVATLEKNVADMQKLLALKSGAGAQAQQQAEAAKAAAAPPPPAVKAPTPAPAVQTAAAALAAKAPEPAKAVPTQVAQATPPAAAPKAPEAAPKAPEAAKAPEAPKAPEVAKAPEAPKAAPVAAAPAAKAAPKAAPAPDLLDEMVALGQEYYIQGLGLAVVLLGYAAYAWRKKKREAGAATELTGAPGSDANSVFGTSGGQNIDTASSSFQSDFSQSGIGKIDTEEIDPIAEADVYMAYGRDAQAEEILKEALAKDSSRPAIRLKLLEIYANRKDKKAFQDVASELQSATGGQGPEWEKALSLGRGIDPRNPMYAGGAPEITVPDVVPSPAAAAPVMPDLVLPTTEAPAPSLDFNLDLGGAGSNQPDIALDAEPAAAASAPGGGLDFDLGLGGGDKSAREKSDFSPGGTLIIDAPLAPAAPGPASDAPLNFDLELPGTAASPPAAAPEAPAAPGPAEGMIEFDLGGLAAAAPQAEPEPAQAPALDLSAISLDIGAEPEAAGPAGGGAPDARWQEVATKLDLAKAYDEMGDKDGARELLKEVVKEGDTAQQQRASHMLAALGAA